LRNVHVNLIEASPNLIAKQQERILADLKGGNINMFLSYDVQLHQRQRAPTEDSKAQGEIRIERFFNKDQNFSISWFPSLQDYQTFYM